MKATLGLALACSMVIYASPSLMGMNSSNLPANDQSSAGVLVTDELIDVAKEYFANRDSYRGGKRAYAYQGLYLSSWLQKRRKLNMSLGIDNTVHEQIRQRATGTVIPLANDSFLLQLYTPGDGRCFDYSIELDYYDKNGNPRNDIRSSNIQSLLSILKSANVNSAFWSILRKIAPAIIMNGELLNVLLRHDKSIVHNDTFAGLCNSENLRNLFASLMKEEDNVDEVGYFEQNSNRLVHFLNNNNIENATSIDELPQNFYDLNFGKDGFYQLLRYTVRRHFDLREKIADLALLLELNTWREASCQYLEAINEGYGSYGYDFVSTLQVGDQEIASGYAGAALELKLKNVLVFAEEIDGGIFTYNFGENGSPYEIVGLRGDHYSRWIYVDPTHSEEVLRLMSEKARHRAEGTIKMFSKILKSSPEELNRKNQERIRLKQRKIETYNIVSRQLQYSSATSKKDQVNKGLDTPISNSGMLYRLNEDDTDFTITDLTVGKMLIMMENEMGSEHDPAKISPEEFYQYAINTLVRDRKFMPDIIIWTIRDNMYKLQQLIDWADGNGLNPEKVFGFNPIKKLESYRETANITRKFKTDVPDTDLIYDEWIQILLKGNGILQKCYAKMSGDAYALNSWISFIKEDSKNAAKYLLNNVYYDKKWMSWSYFLIAGNAHKLETLKRFIDLHDNRSRRKSEKDKCINIAINKEEFGNLLKSRKQELIVSDVFGQQTPTDRLLTFSIQYNQRRNDKITGSDICKVLGELRQQEPTKMESYGMILAELPSKHKHAFDIPSTVSETEQQTTDIDSLLKYIDNEEPYMQ